MASQGRGPASNQASPPLNLGNTVLLVSVTRRVIHGRIFSGHSVWPASQLMILLWIPPAEASGISNSEKRNPRRFRASGALYQTQ
jgi:hypothetical protein